MFRKLFSKALLSVVMDKSARENLKHKRIIKKAREISSGEGPGETPEVEDPQELIAASLKAAEEELASKPEMTPDRRALIQKALAVQRSQAHLLESLSEEQREKLYVVAMRSLKSDPGAMVRKNTPKRGKKRK